MEDLDQLWESRDYLQLQQWQRRLLKECADYEATIQEHQQTFQRQQNSSQALQLELQHWRQRKSQAATRNTQEPLQVLSQLVLGAQGKDSNDTEDRLATAEEFQDFFQADIHNPEDKNKIISRLRNEVQQRGQLETQISLVQQKHQGYQKELKEAATTIQSVQQGLQAMEKASLRGQKLLKGQNISSIRLALVAAAQKLPAPLYTVYGQLQQFCDEQDETDDSKSSMTISIPQPHAVHWSILFLDAHQKTKRIVLQFTLDESQELVVKASGCAATLYQQDVLDNVLDGWTVFLTGKITHQVQKLYSVRFVAHYLQRRFRANAILKYILQYIHQQLDLPALPNEDAEKKKLFQKFVCETPATPHEFDLELASCKLHVSLSLSEYPSKIPLITCNDPEYDWLMDQVNAPSTTSEDDEYYHWILVHQLRQVVQGLEEKPPTRRGRDRRPI